VVQTAPNRVDVDEFNRWTAPLNDAVAQVVAGDLWETERGRRADAEL
jgi:uncharacterized lipoprotein YmbA